MIPTHQRSKSFPDKSRAENEVNDSHEHSLGLKLEIGRFKNSFHTKKQHSPRVETQNSLKQEILQLEKRLQNQFAVRGALEKALGSGSLLYETNELSTISMSTTELIKEIAALELEVTYLEQYLLSLYRKSFDKPVSPGAKDVARVSSLSLKAEDKSRIRMFVDEEAKFENVRNESALKSVSGRLEENIGGKMAESNVRRCHSSLSYRALLPEKPYSNSLSEALRMCHSQPLSMTQYAGSNVISLAEHLGTRISDHVSETPNRISEDMVKCMAAIFCKLSSASNGLSSPNSSSPAFSPRHQCDAWSPGLGKYSSFDTRLDNPFSGPYSTMVEVQCIYRDTHKLGDVEHMLHNFRSLISRLQEVDLKKMRHEEKLAFWTNVHNALVMHAILAYGIPQNNVKRGILLLKAAYNVGGHTVTADTIQSTVLLMGCRISRPAQWLRIFIGPKKNLKTGDDGEGYALEHPEPLLHFALCSGTHSDPTLQVYTPKRVLQELEGAKDMYIRATLGVRKDHKVTLPKLVDTYAKDLGISPAGIIEMIQQSLLHSDSDSLRKTLKKCQSAKSRNTFQWIPHNLSFRYLISKELLK